MKKTLLVITVLITLLSSCKKSKYDKFSSKELDFVNYSEGQIIKFIDTTLSNRTFVQNTYKRDFREWYSMLGKTQRFSETYEVSYHTQAGTRMGLSIELDNGYKSLEIILNGYTLFAHPDSINPSINLMTINGINYKNVYKEKVYKTFGLATTDHGRLVFVNNEFVSNPDTATLYHNKEYGVIQLLFPGGKRILRTD